MESNYTEEEKAALKAVEKEIEDTYVAERAAASRRTALETKRRRIDDEVQSRINHARFDRVFTHLFAHEQYEPVRSALGTANVRFGVAVNPRSSALRVHNVEFVFNMVQFGPPLVIQFDVCGSSASFYVLAADGGRKYPLMPLSPLNADRFRHDGARLPACLQDTVYMTEFLVSLLYSASGHWDMYNWENLFATHTVGGVRKYIINDRPAHFKIDIGRHYLVFD